MPENNLQFVDVESSPRKNQRPRNNSRSKIGMPQPRRKSSNLITDIRGDTGAPAMSTLEPLSPLISPVLTPRTSDAKIYRPHSKRRKARSFLRRCRNTCARHTWLIPLFVTLVVLAAYLVNPTTTNPVHSAIFLSYPLDPSDPLIPAHAPRGPGAPTQYGKGGRDFIFIAFYTAVLSFTREFLTQRLIRPTAIYYGIRSRAKQYRFMEQVYTAMYFSIFGPYGLYVMSRTPVWYFNTRAMYEDYPHRAHDGLFKAYYLLQASYWIQQVIVLCLMLEKPRKDFKELVGHHIVTLALIWLSYRFHFTYMGLAVYITHDISDFFLASSKSLNYLQSPIQVPYFSIFMAVWVYLRHFLNLVILTSIFTQFSTVGPFELNWETQQYKCWISQAITFSLLACLQAINLFWLYLIVRIAFNVVFARKVEDVRSEGEEDEEEEPVVGGKEVKLNGAMNGNGNGKMNGVNGVRKLEGEGKKEI